jgi:hypothetical protein
MPAPKGRVVSARIQGRQHTVDLKAARDQKRGDADRGFEQIKRISPQTCALLLRRRRKLVKELRDRRNDLHWGKGLLQ